MRVTCESAAPADSTVSSLGNMSLGPEVIFADFILSSSNVSVELIFGSV